MSTFNVYTYYDETKTIIARIRPFNGNQISLRTYNNLLKKRTIGGCAGVYTDAGFDIDVVNNNGDVVAFIR